jgi:hypothetical protein
MIQLITGNQSYYSYLNPTFLNLIPLLVLFPLPLFSYRLICVRPLRGGLENWLSSDTIIHPPYTKVNFRDSVHIICCRLQICDCQNVLSMSLSRAVIQIAPQLYNARTNKVSSQLLSPTYLFFTQHWKMSANDFYTGKTSPQGMSNPFSTWQGKHFAQIAP